MNSPVDSATEVSGSEDVSQLKLVGKMAIIISGGLFLMVLFPNPMIARGIIAATAGLVFVVGFFMSMAGRHSK